MSIKIKVGIIIEDNDRILMIRESMQEKSKPLWNFIKGTYEEEKDSSIFDTALRECIEESCVSVEITEVLGCYFSKNKGDVRFQINFMARINDGIPAVPNPEDQKTRNEFISEIKWFTRDELTKMNSDDFISERTYIAITDYLMGIRYPLGVIKNIP